MFIVKCLLSTSFGTDSKIEKLVPIKKQTKSKVIGFCPRFKDLLAEYKGKKLNFKIKKRVLIKEKVH